MIKYRAYSDLTHYEEKECSHIVVYSAQGDPVSITIPVGKEVYITSHMGNPDFDSLIKAFNIKKLEKDNG